MPILSASSNVIVNGGIFVDTSNAYTGSTGIDTLLEASSPEATHDSSARYPPPRCFPGTREQYINDILQWASSPIDQNSYPLLWLRGPAGVGKTAIAQTCVERLEGLCKPCTSFFFSVSGCNDSKRLFTSIAYQISTRHSEYRDIVDQKIRHDRTLVDKAMPSQFQALIMGPLLELERMGRTLGRILIIVDGIDECEGTTAQCEIIRIVASACRECPALFRWAFFSRTEAHLDATFAETSIASLCRYALLPVSHEADEEITLYLRDGLESVRRRRHLQLQSHWPSRHDVEIVVTAADGLFILAAAVLRFIDRPGCTDPEEALRSVVDVIVHGHQDATAGFQNPLTSLDALYLMILQNIPGEFVPSTTLFLAALCTLNHGRSAIIWSNLLALSMVKLRAICDQLSAVLQFQEQGEFFQPDHLENYSNQSYQHVPSDDFPNLREVVRRELGGTIHIHHKSFLDFLKDPLRSGRFCIYSADVSGALYEHCINRWLEYDRSCYFGPASPYSTPPLAPSPSNPHATELVKSITEAEVYGLVFYISTTILDYRELDLRLWHQLTRCDFRKNLHIRLDLHVQDTRVSTRYRGCKAQLVNIRGKVLLCYVLPADFLDFDVDKFKKMLKRRQKAGIIKPYYPNLLARLRSYLHRINNSKASLESGLYVMGRGQKAVFWYWEVDYDKKYFQYIQSADLSGIQRVHQEEKIEKWLKNWDDWPRRPQTSVKII